MNVYINGSQLGDIFPASPPQKTLTISGDISDCGFYWVEARDVAKPPTVYRTASRKEFLAQTVNSAKTEKP